MFDAIGHLAESDSCFVVETMEAIMSSHSGLIDPLETSLVQDEQEILCKEAEGYVKWMDSFEPNRRKYYEPLGENTQRSVPSFEKPQLE